MRFPRHRPENNRPPRGERPASSGDDLSVPRQRPSPRLPPGTNYKGETYDFGNWVRLEITQGIHGVPVDPDLEVQVGAEAVARVPDKADHLTLTDLRTGRDSVGRLVRVARRQAPAVVDAGVVAVAPGPAGEHDAAARCGVDRRPRGRGNVYACVKPSPAVAERARYRAAHGPDQPRRRRCRIARALCRRKLPADSRIRGSERIRLGNKGLLLLAGGGKRPFLLATTAR